MKLRTFLIIPAVIAFLYALGLNLHARLDGFVLRNWDEPGRITGGAVLRGRTADGGIDNLAGKGPNWSQRAARDHRQPDRGRCRYYPSTYGNAIRRDEFNRLVSGRDLLPAHSWICLFPVYVPAK